MTILFISFGVTAVLLVAIALYSLIATRNLMRILLSVELTMKAVTLLLIGAGYNSGKMGTAQSYVITIVVVEVMLLVVAVGIVYNVYRRNGSLDTKGLNNLKG